MKRTSLNYHFHNPNADDLMEKYMRKLVVEQGVKQLMDILKSDSDEKEKE